jgi:hypothetical protein
MHCWGLQTVSDFVLRLNEFGSLDCGMLLLVGGGSHLDKRRKNLVGRLAIEPRMDPIALREGFQIWETVGKSFCINVSVIAEFVLQRRLSVASNLYWPANSRRKFGVTSGGSRSTAAPRDFSTPTRIVNPVRALL